MHLPSFYRLLILLAATSCFSSYTSAIQLSFAGPPTVEEVSFVLANTITESSPSKIRLRCEECPKQLIFTTNSAVYKAGTEQKIETQNLDSGRRYHSIYISYDPETLHVLSALLY